MTDILLIVGGYLFGSISTAIVVCRLMGLPDPRGVGSGNPGATNVLRIGGKKAAGITLLGDSLKGLAPMLVAHLLDASPAVLAATGLAAFLGHPAAKRPAALRLGLPRPRVSHRCPRRR